MTLSLSNDTLSHDSFSFLSSTPLKDLYSSYISLSISFDAFLQSLNSSHFPSSLLSKLLFLSSEIFKNENKQISKKEKNFKFENENISNKKRKISKENYRISTNDSSNISNNNSTNQTLDITNDKCIISHKTDNSRDITFFELLLSLSSSSDRSLRFFSTSIILHNLSISFSIDMIYRTFDDILFIRHRDICPQIRSICLKYLTDFIVKSIEKEFNNNIPDHSKLSFFMQKNVLKLFQYGLSDTSDSVRKNALKRTSSLLSFCLRKKRIIESNEKKESKNDKDLTYLKNKEKKVKDDNNLNDLRNKKKKLRKNNHKDNENNTKDNECMIESNSNLKDNKVKLCISSIIDYFYSITSIFINISRSSNSECSRTSVSSILLNLFMNEELLIKINSEKKDKNKNKFDIYDVMEVMTEKDINLMFRYILKENEKNNLEDDSNKNIKKVEKLRKKEENSAVILKENQNQDSKLENIQMDDFNIFEEGKIRVEEDKIQVEEDKIEVEEDKIQLEEKSLGVLTDQSFYFSMFDILFKIYKNNSKILLKVNLNQEEIKKIFEMINMSNNSCKDENFDGTILDHLKILNILIKEDHDLIKEFRDILIIHRGNKENINEIIEGISKLSYEIFLKNENTINEIIEMCMELKNIPEQIFKIIKKMEGSDKNKNNGKIVYWIEKYKKINKREKKHSSLIEGLKIYDLSDCIDKETPLEGRILGLMWKMRKEEYGFIEDLEHSYLKINNLDEFKDICKYFIFIHKEVGEDENKGTYDYKHHEEKVIEYDYSDKNSKDKSYENEIKYEIFDGNYEAEENIDEIETIFDLRSCMKFIYKKMKNEIKKYLNSNFLEIKCNKKEENKLKNEENNFDFKNMIENRKKRISEKKEKTENNEIDHEKMNKLGNIYQNIMNIFPEYLNLIFYIEKEKLYSLIQKNKKKSKELTEGFLDFISKNKIENFGYLKKENKCVIGKKLENESEDLIEIQENRNLESKKGSHQSNTKNKENKNRDFGLEKFTEIATLLSKKIVNEVNKNKEKEKFEKYSNIIYKYTLKMKNRKEVLDLIIEPFVKCLSKEDAVKLENIIDIESKFKKSLKKKKEKENKTKKEDGDIEYGKVEEKEEETTIRL